MAKFVDKCRTGIPGSGLGRLSIEPRGVKPKRLNATAFRARLT